MPIIIPPDGFRLKMTANQFERQGREVGNLKSATGEDSVKRRKTHFQQLDKRSIIINVSSGVLAILGAAAKETGSPVEPVVFQPVPADAPLLGYYRFHFTPPSLNR